MNTPRPVTTAIRRLNPLALGTPAQRDEFAKAQLAKDESWLARKDADRKTELQRRAKAAEDYRLRMDAADRQAEELTESRVHRNTRPQRHE